MGMQQKLKSIGTALPTTMEVLFEENWILFEA